MIGAILSAIGGAVRQYIGLYALGSCLTAIVCVVCYHYYQDAKATSDRRVKFEIIAETLYAIEDSNGKLPVDINFPSAVADAVRANSWRLELLHFLDNTFGYGGEQPWYAAEMAVVRREEFTVFHRPGNLCSTLNAVNPGGPGAGTELIPSERGKRILVVESYPGIHPWYEGGDLDLEKLLVTKTVSEALMLDKANRTRFVAIFSDFSCAEIKATIPPTVLSLWVAGRLQTEAEKRDCAAHIVWSTPGFGSKK